MLNCLTLGGRGCRGRWSVLSVCRHVCHFRVGLGLRIRISRSVDKKTSRAKLHVLKYLHPGIITLPYHTCILVYTGNEGTCLGQSVRFARMARGSSHQDEKKSSRPGLFYVGTMWCGASRYFLMKSSGFQSNRCRIDKLLPGLSGVWVEEVQPCNLFSVLQPG
jgi:hypothetical protein